ncbi:Soluble lytic murein transglycosylase precursor [Shimwellia blattae]|nr:Soluble lytic murein transglycosylase precursor [Shimwellia blattae]
MGKAKQIMWRALAAGVCVLTLNQVARADSLDEQRNRYAQVKQAWDNRQMDVVAQLMPTLRDYPLYPYLEYRQLTDDLANETTIGVAQFIEKNPTLPLARSLKSRFVNELARRQDWNGVLAFSPEPPPATEAKCNFYYAKWSTGQGQAAWAGARTLWPTGKNMPAACESLFASWRTSGNQQPQEYLERIRLAIKQGNTSLVSRLASDMPPGYQSLSAPLVSLAGNPNSVMSFARAVPATDFSRDAVIAAFASVARQDAENARLMLPSLIQAQQFTDKQAQALHEVVAWRLMGNDATSEQARWRDDVVMRSDDASLIERRIRMALGTGDHAGLNTWIARLPMDDKQKDEWQYWQADLLLEQGRDDEGKAILRELMKKRGFYPMAAAQKLGEEYTLYINKPPEVNPALVQGPEMARIRELMYWGLDNTARGEWSGYIASRSKDEQGALASYALDRGWWDLSVQATIAGKLWDNLRERFPLAYKNLFERYTSGKAVSVSYAMAIARQESAWNPKIGSPVGASGLMQLMPATAQHTARMFSIPGYSSQSQLLDPEMNINLGTSYLQYVIDQFGNNRIFASVAYNAGPGRVRTWLGNSAGRIDAVAFIESIPFSETRGYVKNVLAYDAYYRYFMGGQYHAHDRRGVAAPLLICP